MPTIDDYHLLQRLNHAPARMAGPKAGLNLYRRGPGHTPWKPWRRCASRPIWKREKKNSCRSSLFGPARTRRKTGPSVGTPAAAAHRLPLPPAGLARGLPPISATRLRVAGYRGDELFAKGAARALHRANGGTPRLVAVLANKALFSVFGEGKRLVRRAPS